MLATFGLLYIYSQHVPQSASVKTQLAFQHTHMHKKKGVYESVTETRILWMNEEVS